MTPPSSADGAGTGVAASRILLGPGASSDYPTCHRLQVILATRICATHTHTCKWKFQNFSCELVRLKAKFSTRLISLFRSFCTQFLVSLGRVRFPATTCLPDAGLGLLCILILFIESIFPPGLILYFSFSPWTPHLFHLFTTLLAPPLPFSFSQSSPLSLLRPPLQIPSPLAPNIFIQLWRTTPKQPAHANQPTKLNPKKKNFKKQNQTRIFVQRDHQIFFTIQQQQQRQQQMLGRFAKKP